MLVYARRVPSLQRNVEAHWRELFDRTLVLAPDSDEVFHLTGSAAEIWALLEQETTTDRLVGELTHRYPVVAPDVLEGEVRRFIDDLRVHGLLRRPR